MKLEVVAIKRCVEALAKVGNLKTNVEYGYTVK